MKRIRTIIATGIALGTLVIGCSGDESTPAASFESFFPADNAVGSLVEDTSVGVAGDIDKAVNDQQAAALINGDADPFMSRGFDAFGIEYYSDGTHSLELRIWQLKTAASTSEIYTALPTEITRYDAAWETLSLGDGARVVDSGSSWWLNAHKGKYFVEVVGLAPNDAAGKQVGIDVVTFVVGKLP